MASPPTTPPTEQVPQREREGGPIYWLLLIPIVLPLLTPLFNADGPRLFGFPRFYWLQLAFIIVGVSTTTLVYHMTKRKR